MKKILIVDNDAVTCSTLLRVLKKYADRIETRSASNGKEAMECMNAEAFDLVITELEMSVMDGIDLVYYAKKNFPTIPVFVMNAFCTQEMMSRINTIGFTRYFEKPLNMEFLLECIFEEIDSEVEGKVNGISLPSYLQMIERETGTCTLVVSSKERKGKLRFLNGCLMSAETENMKKERAAYEIVSWDEADIRIKKNGFNKNREIKEPLKHILMKGLEKKDEKIFGSTAGPENRKKNQVLKDLKSVPVVIGAFIADSENNILAKDIPPEYSENKLERAGKSVARIFSADKAGLTGLSEISVYCEDAIIVSRKLSNDSYLVVLCENGANLKLMEMSVNLAKDKLKSVLDQKEKIKSVSERDVKKPADKTNGGKAASILSSSPMSDSLRAMQLSLSKIMGPISEFVFVDAVNRWIDVNEPTFSSIPGLMDILKDEINDPEQFEDYKGSIVPYIGN